jgi:hypothetical protein
MPDDPEDDPVQPLNIHSGVNFGWGLIALAAAVVAIIMILLVALFWHVLGTGGAGQNLPTSGGP